MKPHKRMTKLEELFWEFNSRYFHFGKKKLDFLLGVEWADLDYHNPPLMGKNQSYRVMYSPLPKPWPDKYKILINKRFKSCWRVWAGTLLHEMVHFKLHGKDPSRARCGSQMFQKEMKRLASVGAFNPIW